MFTFVLAVFQSPSDDNEKCSKLYCCCRMFAFPSDGKQKLSTVWVHGNWGFIYTQRHQLTESCAICFCVIPPTSGRHNFKQVNRKVAKYVSFITLSVSSSGRKCVRHSACSNGWRTYPTLYIL